MTSYRGREGEEKERKMKAAKTKYECAKCGYTWESKTAQPTRPPRECPQCKSRYWQEIKDSVNK